MKAMKDQISRMPISLKGINRNPADSVPDGALFDALNMRYADSSLRPVQPKLMVDFSVPQFNILFKHAISETMFAWIGEDQGYISTYLYINGEPDTLQSQLYYFNDPATLHFAALGKSLLISCEETETTVLFLFNSDNTTYTYFEDFIPRIPYVKFERSAANTDDETKSVNITATTFAQDEANIMNAYKGMAEDLRVSRSKKGYFIGPYLVRFAWELFDGSIVGHTIPQFMNGSDLEEFFDLSIPNLIPKVRFTGYSNTMAIQIDTSDMDAIKVQYKGIISSLNMYMTNTKEFFYQSWDTMWNNGAQDWFSLCWPPDTPAANERKRTESEIFYFRCIKYSLASLGGFTVDVGVSMDDVTMIPTGEVLTPSTGLHKVYGKTLFSYNQRIFSGNIKNTLFKGQPLMGTFGVVSNFTIGTLYYIGHSYDIETPEGTRSVFTGWYPWLGYNGANWAYTIRGFIGYPDSRATRCQIWHNTIAMNDPHLVHNLTLIPVPGMNFAFNMPALYFPLDFSMGFPVVHQSGSIWQAGSPPDNPSYYDPDRIQATEFSNPFYFPAVNSYRVDGFVLAMATNAIALSQGQFGQFPIYAFTTQGIWVMTIGNGDILIETIKPLSRLIATNPNNIIGIDGAVVFACSEGLMILSGVNTVNISKDMEGSFISPLADNLDYQQIMNNLNVMTPYLSREEQQGHFRNYLTYCSIAYVVVRLNDSVQRELVLTAEESFYSYLYNIESKTWSRLSTPNIWEHFVFDWPFAYGVRSDRTGNPWLWYMDDMQNEFQDPTGDNVTYPVLNFYAETRPIKFGETISYKKVLRSILYGLIKSNPDHPFTFYIFGSPDEKNWYTLNASNTISPGEKIILGRSSFSCRSFIIVLGGHVSDQSYLSGLIFDIEKRYNQKLH